jgi:hypothetical protein
MQAVCTYEVSAPGHLVTGLDNGTEDVGPKPAPITGHPYVGVGERRQRRAPKKLGNLLFGICGYSFV